MAHIVISYPAQTTPKRKKTLYIITKSTNIFSYAAAAEYMDSVRKRRQEAKNLEVAYVYFGVRTKIVLMQWQLCNQTHTGNHLLGGRRQ